MTMAWIWTGMAVLSILCGLATGRGDLVAAAAVEGAQAAVELCVSIAGMLCLWTGVMEIMRRSGLAEGLSRLLRPVLSALFPQVSGDRGVMDSISANVSANLLGLGNAATPLGIEAVRRMERKSPGTASDAMCMLAVLHTTSMHRESEARPGERRLMSRAAWIPRGVAALPRPSRLADTLAEMLSITALSRAKSG